MPSGRHILTVLSKLPLASLPSMLHDTTNTYLLVYEALSY